MKKKSSPVLSESRLCRSANGLFLAFDFGTKTIGLACGQNISKTATPLPPLVAKDGVPDWQQLESVLQEWQPCMLIVGLPLNMDGSNSEMGKKALKFARRLEGRFNIPFSMMDERLSSYEAEMVCEERGWEHFSIDSICAALILESWFNHE